MARKNVEAVVDAWLAGKSKSVGPVSTDGTTLRSYALPIAVRDGNRVLIARRGPSLYSATTTQHLSSVYELLRDEDLVVLRVNIEDLRRASYGGDALEEVVIVADHQRMEREKDILRLEAERSALDATPADDDKALRKKTRALSKLDRELWQLKYNPSGLSPEDQWRDLVKDPDPAAMLVAEDVVVQHHLSLATLSMHWANDLLEVGGLWRSAHTPQRQYDHRKRKLVAARWMGAYLLGDDTWVAWSTHGHGTGYEIEVIYRIWERDLNDQAPTGYTAAIGHTTYYKTLNAAMRAGAADAWVVAKEAKRILAEGNQDLTDDQIRQRLIDAMFAVDKTASDVYGGRRAPKKWGRFDRPSGGRRPPPRENPPIDDVRTQYAALVQRGMARVLWAHAYGAWAQQDIAERDPDAIDFFPTIVLRELGGPTGPEGGDAWAARRVRFARALAKRPPNMPIWIEHAPPTPNAANNAAAWLAKLVSEREGVESVVDLFAIVHEIDTGEVFEYVDPTPQPKKRPDGSLVTRPAGREIFYSDSRGTRIPQDFAEEIDRSTVTGVDDETWTTLEAGDTAENEWYWEAWDDVLRNAVITDRDGQKWRLEQDGDLFIIPKGMEWDDDEQDYVWPEEDPEVPTAEEFGRCLGHMCLADGISWFDEHKQKSTDGRIEWQPNLPVVFAEHDDENLEWGVVGQAGPEDVHKESTEHRIAITFERITPLETDENEHEYETGWEDEDGVVIEEDDEEGSIPERTAEFLRNRGATEASSSEFHPGIWYTQIDGDTDYQTGVETRLSFHLRGYTPEEEKAVYEAWRRFGR